MNTIPITTINKTQPTTTTIIIVVMSEVSSVSLVCSTVVDVLDLEVDVSGLADVLDALAGLVLLWVLPGLVD